MDYNAIRDFIDRIAATIKEFYKLLSDFIAGIKSKTLAFEDNTVEFVPEDSEG